MKGQCHKGSLRISGFQNSTSFTVIAPIVSWVAYLQKKSKEILLIQAPTSADYLSVCSVWKHFVKNREYLNCLTNLIFNLHAKDIHDFFNRR